MGLLGTNNITTTLVGNAIGSAIRTVSGLCSNINVNKFSKFKPIEFDSDIGLTQQNFIDANYGLEIEPMSDMKNTEGKQWKYNKPTSKFRLGDFRNYYHEAPIALLQKKGQTYTVNRFNGSGADISFDILPAPSGYENYCLNVGNLYPISGLNGVLLNNYYLGAAIYNNGGTLKGIYYAYYPIKYTQGTGAEMLGATIYLSAGNYFVSDYNPIESYLSGNYTVYLFITNYGKDLAEGSIRRYWPVNFTSQFPQNIAMNILDISEIFEIDIIGIRPQSGIWNDGSTSFRVGTITEEMRGFDYLFDIKMNIYNKTSETVYLNLYNCKLFFSKLDSWGGSSYRASISMGKNQLKSINANSYIEVTWGPIQPFPDTFPPSPGTLSLSPHLHYMNNDNVDQFPEIPQQTIITFNYGA